MVELKKNLLSVALLSALSMAAASAHAQDAQQTDAEKKEEAAKSLDTVVVTGIRGSIERSIEAKQDASTMVEAISAEDIGKLPDTSIADSLARLPGLTAQRFGGRPQEINIRGFAGDFSTGLLNGREQVSMGNNRGVEFDQFPSELMSSVIVHKTTQADLVGQGLSGTVNLRTARPLDYDQRIVAVNARADMNKVADEKEYGNRYSISYIDQFADNTVGLALGYARLNNPGQSHQFGSWGYNDVGALGGGNVFAFENDNSRDGLMATLEYRPSNDFRSILDVFYSRFDKDEAKRGVQFGLSNQVGTQYSASNTLQSGTATASPVVLRNDLNFAHDDMLSIGWRNEANLGSNWTLKTDVATSKGTREERILETYGVMRPGVNNTVGFSYNPDGYFDFDFASDLSNIANFALMDPGGWGGDLAQAGYLKDFTVRDRINLMRVDLERSFDTGFISSVVFGANLTDRRKTRGSDENTLCVTLACSTNVAGDIPAGSTSNVALGFAGIDNFLSLDPQALVNSYFYLMPKYHEDIAAKNWRINERVTTYYVQANIDTELGSIPLRGNIGVQAVNAKQSSSGWQTYSGLATSNLAGAAVEGSASYTDYLPSMNLSFGLPSDQFVRFGASRQMARPRMDQLIANDNISVVRQDANRPDPYWKRDGGNPDLQPWLADAYDISYEKYFGGNRGYVSAAYFYKDLKSYIYDLTTTFDIRDTTVPQSAWPADVASPTGDYVRPANGTGGVIKGFEFAVSLPFGLLWAPLEGFGFYGSYSDTRSSIQPDGPDNPTTPLPGLSKYVSNMSLYYERFGFSARVSQRSRSAFLGEVQGAGGDRTRVYFDGEEVVDAQLGYTFQSGPLQNLGFLLQVNNLTDEPFRRFSGVEDRPNEFTEYGRTYLFGVNYRF